MDELEIRSMVDECLAEARTSHCPDPMIAWLTLAEMWEARLPAVDPDAPSGFADIGAQPGETCRIVLCIAPDQVAVVVDRRFKQPLGAVRPTLAEAVSLALEVYDRTLLEEE